MLWLKHNMKMKYKEKQMGEDNQLLLKKIY